MLRVRQHISQLMGLGCFFEALLPFAVRDEITRQDAFWSEQMGQSYGEEVEEVFFFWQCCVQKELWCGLLSLFCFGT